MRANRRAEKKKYQRAFLRRHVLDHPSKKEKKACIWVQFFFRIIFFLLFACRPKPGDARRTNAERAAERFAFFFFFFCNITVDKEYVGKTRGHAENKRGIFSPFFSS